MNEATPRVSRLLAAWKWNRLLPILFIGLVVTFGASFQGRPTVLANGGEISAFTGKSAQYNTYYSTRSCGSCHGADTSVPNLKSYGAAFWNRLVAAYGSSRTLANEQNALTDIEPGDADGDGFSNIVEINANRDASLNSDFPTLAASVTATTGQNAKSGTVSTTVSYTVTVTNTGNKKDSFTLGVSVTSGQSWTTSITGTASNLLGQPTNGTASITVNVVIPGGALAGQTSVATFTTTSQANGAVSATPLTLTTTAAASASPRYVNASTGTNTGTCSSSGSPCKTITYAMSQAVAGNPGDLINVAPGTYNVGLGEVFPDRKSVV